MSHQLVTQETDKIVDTEPGADEPVEAPDDKSMHSDLLSDVDKAVQDPGADTDTTVEYSEDTMAEIPVGQNDQTGETDLEYNQHEILKKKLIVKLEMYRLPKVVP